MGTDAVIAIIKAGLRRCYPERQKDAARDMIEEFWEHGDFDEVQEIENLLHCDEPAIVRAAEEIVEEWDRNSLLSEKCL